MTSDLPGAVPQSNIPPLPWAVVLAMDARRHTWLLVFVLNLPRLQSSSVSAFCEFPF